MLINGTPAEKSRADRTPETKVSGLQMGLFNLDPHGRTRMNGIQIGIINQNGGGRNVQFGAYNSSGQCGERVNLGVGYNIYEDVEEKKPSHSPN